MADPRILILAAGAAFLIGALAYDPIPATGAALGSAALAIVALEWRRRPVLNAATKLAHTFCFTDGSCKPELQELAKAILLWNKKLRLESGGHVPEGKGSKARPPKGSAVVKSHGA